MQSLIYPNRAKAYKSMTMLVLRELTKKQHRKEKILNYKQAIGAVYNSCLIDIRVFVWL